MTPEVEPAIQALLACPRCGSGPLDLADAQVTCSACDWAGQRQGRILSVSDAPLEASFDDKHDMVDDHNHHPKVWDLCYRRQCAAIEATLEPGGVLLDLGCGPAAPYAAPGVRIIGVDPSMRSLAINDDIALGLHTTAGRLPLTDASVDAVVAIYSLHHMIGSSVEDTAANVEQAFAEIARVAKPGAEVIVMEISPWRFAWPAERLGWGLARRLLPSIVDFVFWPAHTLAELGRRTFPGATLTTETLDIGRFDVFPPVIGITWLKIPRCTYPFDVVLLRWRLGDGTAAPPASAPGPWWRVRRPRRAGR